MTARKGTNTPHLTLFQPFTFRFEVSVSETPRSFSSSDCSWHAEFWACAKRWLGLPLYSSGRPPTEPPPYCRMQGAWPDLLKLGCQLPPPCLLTLQVGLRALQLRPQL